MCLFFFSKNSIPPAQTKCLSIQIEGHCLCNLAAQEDNQEEALCSHAVATHHLLAEIRASHQNIKEVDIYWGSTCVFSVNLITEFLPLFTPTPLIPVPT